MTKTDQVRAERMKREVSTIMSRIAHELRRGETVDRDWANQFLRKTFGSLRAAAREEEVFQAAVDELYAALTTGEKRVPELNGPLVVARERLERTLSGIALGLKAGLTRELRKARHARLRIDWAHGLGDWLGTTAGDTFDIPQIAKTSAIRSGEFEEASADVVASSALALLRSGRLTLPDFSLFEKRGTQSIFDWDLRPADEREEEPGDAGDWPAEEELEFWTRQGDAAVRLEWAQGAAVTSGPEEPGDPESAVLARVNRLAAEERWRDLWESRAELKAEGLTPPLGEQVTYMLAMAAFRLAKFEEAKRLLLDDIEHARDRTVISARYGLLAALARERGEFMQGLAYVERALTSDESNRGALYYGLVLSSLLERDDDCHQFAGRLFGKHPDLALSDSFVHSDGDLEWWRGKSSSYGVWKQRISSEEEWRKFEDLARELYPGAAVPDPPIETTTGAKKQPRRG